MVSVSSRKTGVQGDLHASSSSPSRHRSSKAWVAPERLDGLLDRVRRGGGWGVKWVESWRSDNVGRQEAALARAATAAGGRDIRRR